MSTTVGRKVAISGPGLKKEGIIVLQFFFIGIFSYIELLFRNGCAPLHVPKHEHYNQPK